MLVAGLLVISIDRPADRRTPAPARFASIFGEIAHPSDATTARGARRPDAHGAARDRCSPSRRSPARASSPASLAGVAQVGFAPTPQALKPDFRRINPASGLKNLLGPNAVFEALKAIAKVAVVGAVAALALLPGLTGSPPTSASRRWRSASWPGRARSRSPQHAAFAYLLVGVIDYAWKRHRHEHQLMMTKQEVKDEVRQYGVSAEVRVGAAPPRRCRPRARA